MMGPRFSVRRSRGVTPFVHALVGALHIRSSYMGDSGSGTEFAIQPGAGADFWVGRRLGIRVGADYRRTIAEDASNQVRFHAGLVLAFGRR